MTSWNLYLDEQEKQYLIKAQNKIKEKQLLAKFQMENRKTCYKGKHGLLGWSKSLQIFDIGKIT